MKKIIQFVQKNKILLACLILFFVSRSYRLHDYAIFLGDQGRDAIIMKRLILGEKLTLIGPPTSIGNVFLGPFFYYLMAPWLLLSGFDPIGPVWGSLIVSTILILISFKYLSKIYPTKTLIIFGLLAFSSKELFESSRYSWNPNLLGYFGLITIIIAHFAKKKNSLKYFYILGVMLGLSSQLHYLAILLLPALMLYLFIGTPIAKNEIINSLKSYLKKLLIIGAGLTTALSPLALFDLKHDFINTKSFLNVFSSNEFSSQEPFLNTLYGSLHGFLKQVWQYDFSSHYLVWFFLILITLYLVLNLQKYIHLSKEPKSNQFDSLLIFSIFTYLLLFGLLNSGRHFHYYLPIFLLSYLFLASLISRIKSKLSFYIAFLFVIIWSINSIYSWSIFHNFESNRQILEAKIIAQKTIPHIKAQVYQVSATPSTATTGNIRYFLEILGKKPLDEDSQIAGDELIIYCFEKECKLDGHPQWQIATFQAKPNKMEYLDTHVDAKIYRFYRESK